MKKCIMAIVCLMTMVVSANAQVDNDDVKIGEWFTNTTAGDELKGTSDDSKTCFIASEGFIMYLHNANTFALHTNVGFFDYDSYDNAKSVIIGFYDKDKNLVEKLKSKKSDFHIFGAHKDGVLIYSKNLNKAIWDYINNKKGYVRFIIDRYNKLDFDFEVPCMNN